MITSDDILNTIGDKIKKTRRQNKFTQEYVAENIEISTDLLRNIENGRNIGSLATILNLCNFLKMSPNYLFEDLITFKEDTLDTKLSKYISTLSNKSKKTLKDIIVHVDNHYPKQ